MDRIKNFVALSAFSLLVLGLPAIASAQWNGGGYGGYGNGSYNRNIQGNIKNLKNRAKNFERLTNRIEDRRDDRDDRNDRYGRNGRNTPWGNVGWNNGGNIGRLEDLADRFKDATDDLEDSYGRGRNLNGSRDEARRVLDIAGQIDREIYNGRSNRQLQNEWNRMRQDLNVVAQVYGNGGYNNRNGRQWPF